MDLSGKTVSHYKVLRRLGAGGMGVVYMASDLRLDRVVALKFVAAPLNIDDCAQYRLKAEAMAASSLDHPNIGTVYEIDDAPEVGLFIAMAYYKGITLAQKLSQSPLPIGSAIDFATQIADGLAYAHDQGVIHGDIKPGNLIITSAGVVKILDFGLATSVGAEITQPGVLVGTPAFMSPERIAGRPRDASSDIWSLGIVIYNMLTGELPFRGTSAFSIMWQIEAFNPEFRSLPESVRPLLVRTLARTPATRYRRMRDLLADLRAMAPYHVNWLDPPVPQAGNEAATFPASPSSGEISSPSELRQVSILSCELCSYDEIAAELDPERLRDLLIAFQHCCEEVAKRFDGHIERVADAEIRVNFGYPVSHEDDAYRAVCAALAIQSQAHDLLLQLGLRSSLPTVPRTRVGIHTGPVLTEKVPTSTLRSSAVGITSVIAVKALKAAEPGAVLVSASTLALVDRFFKTRLDTEIRVSGKSYLLYSVLSEIKDEQWQDSSILELTPLISRERELEVLTECWQSACSGSGRVAFVMGEAGIGKSRLVRTFRERLSSQPHKMLHCRCSQLRRNSPLSPVIDLLSQVCGLESSLSPSAQVSCVHETLKRRKIHSAADRDAIASLLSIPASEADAPPTIPMRLNRDRTLGLVVYLIFSCSADQPLFLVMEDLHWADPSTLEFLGLVIDQGPASAVLTMLTFRPDFTPPWNRSHVKLLSLDRLNSHETKHMIELLVKNRRLPKSILERLMSNSDGVPLFIEELTKAVLASPAIDKVAGSSSESPAPSTNVVPSSLKDSLMARLDRLGNAKHVAQVASVLGRTFPYRWLQALCPIGEQQLNEGLQRLVEAELFYRRGIPPDEHYTFKHALIRDSAYESLVSASRKRYHSQFAQFLEEHSREIADAQPELVAHHYTEANKYEEAIPYWRRAGQEARRRSASVEASAYFSRALQLIPFVPDSVDRKRSELTLWVSLGSSQLAISGYGADAVRRAFETARSLCADVGENRELFDALQGLWAYYVVHADLNQSLSIASSLDILSATLDDARLKLEASLRHGISCAMLGELTSALEHFERVEHDNQIFDRGQSAITYGQDPVVACLCHLSLVQWLLGYSNSAVMTTMKAVKLATELAHPFTLSWAYLYAAIIHSLRGEPRHTLESAEQLRTVCEEQEFAYRLAQSRILGAWARSQEATDGGAIEDMQSGIDMVQATGARVFRPYYLGMLARACLRGGQLEKGQLCTQLGLQTVKETGERFFEAELHRLNAEFLHKLHPERMEDSTQLLIRALNIAKSQKARALQLKAAISFVEVAPQLPQAVDALEEALSNLPEPQEVPDVDRARLMLARIRIQSTEGMRQ